MLVRSPSRGKGENSFSSEISVGVLFENSIVCHVFYAMALGAAHGLFGCVWFLGLVLFWFAWLLFVGVGWGYVVWFSGLFTDCCSGLASCFVVWGLVGVLLVLFGEFDPGSGRTLAACLTHASRTVKGLVLLVLDEWRTGE